MAEPKKSPDLALGEPMKQTRPATPTTVRIDNGLMTQAKRRARQLGISRNRYIAELIRAETTAAEQQRSNRAVLKIFD